MTKAQAHSTPLPELKKDFYLLRSDEGEKLILAKLAGLEKDTATYLKDWLALSNDSENVYPSQGLLLTPFDYIDFQTKQMLPQDILLKTLRLRYFFLELFNHPYRMHFLNQVNKQNFNPPQKVKCSAMAYSETTGISVSIGDLGASVCGSDKARISRNERYAQGPFIKLGRQARSLFCGSASPDVWNSAAAIATMAASHCLAGIPRNGITSDVRRQTDLARETFVWLKNMKDTLLKGHADANQVYAYWKQNVMGTLEANPAQALARAESLYAVGVRCFRVYSPEPGTQVVETVKALRKEFGDKLELFAGQIVDLPQAKATQDAGADGLYVGIGGGGRCITGVRSGSVIDWPNLVWKLRGELTIPIIAEGGASDHIAVSLLLGLSGIGVSRVVSGGTIESPGGALYCSDAGGNLFKPYGGEASARTKSLDKKLLPFGIPSFVEGETTTAKMNYVRYVLPTLTYNLHILIEDAILALVFRNVETVDDLYNLDPSPLKLATGFDAQQRNTH